MTRLEAMQLLTVLTSSIATEQEKLAAALRLRALIEEMFPE